MILMAVESSCDETAVALVEDGRRVPPGKMLDRNGEEVSR